MKKSLIIQNSSPVGSSDSAEKRRDIAKVAECEISDVNNLIRNFSFMRDMQSWLKTKKENGQELPRDQDELKRKFRKERPINHKEKIRQKMGHRWSKLDQKWNMKWSFAAVQKKLQGN